jgi:diaminohydroxyphosphoribosylaminopyrimidine deaminase/5-amino-6-(5-phosphoribosylamino)uracil reductase
VAQLDPTPDAGGGLRELEAAGIQVTVGVLEAEAASVNELWLTAVRRRRPYVALKVACSLDGIIHSPDASDRWITSSLARRGGHRLRAELGCVLVGSRTVEVDDPQLTARLPGVRRQPLRVVLDPAARLEPHYRVFDQSAETIRLVAGKPRRDGDVPCPTSGRGFEIRALLEILWQRGMTGVLVEGGAQTYRAFLEAGYCDALEMFVSPKVLGSGLRWFDPLSGQVLGARGRFELVSARRVGSDAWLRLRPQCSE